MPGKKSSHRSSRGQAKRNPLVYVVKERPFLIPLLAVILFATLGTYLILFSKAATIIMATVEAETMIALPGTNPTATVVTDSSASSGSALKLTTNGAVTAQFSTAQGVTSITIRAKGVQCQGAPTMEVKIDDTSLPVISASSSGWGDYSIAIPAATSTSKAGNHTLSIGFTNDNNYVHRNHRKNCSRDLYLDKSTVFGQDFAAPTVTLSSSPASITAGSSSTLNWNSTNATSCVASGAWGGNQALSGTATVTPTATSSYALACTGVGGTTVASSNVTVGSALPPTSGTLSQTLGFNTLNGIVSDEFTGGGGSKPDSTRWHSKTYTAPSGVYWNGFSNVQLDGNGNLDIFATRNSTGGWSSSFISGNKSFSGTRYVEARAKVATGYGPWSAPIWEWDAPYGAKGIENDVNEQLGREPQAYHTTLHSSGTQSSKNNSTPSILANDYHKYGAAVYADHVDYYLDDVKVQTVTKTELGGKWGFIENPMVLNISLDMGGWGGAISSSLASPVHMYVDYIRAYTP